MRPAGDFFFIQLSNTRAGVWNAFWIAEAVTAIVSFMISRKKVYL